MNIEIKEHQNLYLDEEFKKLSEEQKEKIEKQKSELFQKNKYSENKNKNSIYGAYFIGADWLIENELALFVNPKIENLDYLKIFSICLDEINKDKREIFDFDLDKKFIPANGLEIDITLFLIIHFIYLLEKIVKRGLKRDYIRIEENLSSKIKGKIAFANHLKKNVMMGREDRVFCNYQEHSVDCLENQVLKKALVFCQHYLAQKLTGDKKETLKGINQKLVFCKSAFGQVSDIKQISQIKHFKVNKLYRDYDKALKIAKIILKRFGYNIQESSKKETKTPPFWIRMDLLFELYVLVKLKKQYGKEIEYQVTTKGHEVDFIKKDKDEKIIIDAKYKNKYMVGKEEKDDIRQVSGYARNESILKRLGIPKNEIENTVVDCLIVYPKKDGIEYFKSEKLLLKEPQKKKLNNLQNSIK